MQQGRFQVDGLIGQIAGIWDNGGSWDIVEGLERGNNGLEGALETELIPKFAQHDIGGIGGTKIFHEDSFFFNKCHTDGRWSSAFVS